MQTNIKNKILDKAEININSKGIKINGKSTSLLDVLVVDSGRLEIIFENEIIFKTEIYNESKNERESEGMFTDKGVVGTVGCLALFPICLLASNKKSSSRVKIIHEKFICSFRGGLIVEAGNRYYIKVKKNNSYDSEIIVSKKYYSNSPIFKKNLECVKLD